MSLMIKSKNCWHFSGKGNECTTFPSVKDVIALDGKVVSRDKISLVKRVSVNDSNYYVKVYWRNGNGFRHYFGRSRLQGEWENLQYFKSLGINTPRIVAYGQLTKHGFLDQGVLVTEEVPAARDLLTISKSNPFLLEDKNWLDQVMHQTAEYSRQLHDCGFVHWDLKWRNILVSMEKKQFPQVYFFDCPLGKKRYLWLRKRGAIKDLACLDKVAKKVLSQKSRMKFFKYYAGCSLLSNDHKSIIRKIIAFF